MRNTLKRVVPMLFIAGLVLMMGCVSSRKAMEEEAARQQAIQDSIAQVEQAKAEKAAAEKARQDSILAVQKAEELRLEQERMAKVEAERKAKESLEIVYFAFDKSNLDEPAKTSLQKNAELIKQYPGWNVVVEGHCDERGSTEYNLALGERRAAAVQKYYIDYGINGSRIEIISYGEERPADPGHNEAAWAKNRRAVTRVK